MALPLLLLIGLSALGVLGWLTLGSGPRATEGRAISLLVPLFLLMAVTLLQAKRGDLEMGGRVNLNAPDLDAATLADATGISTDLAQRVLEVRDSRASHAFRSLGQIPSLGSAPRASVQQVETWARERRWDELQKVVRTGEIAKAGEGGIPPATGAASPAGTAPAAGAASPAGRPGGGLYPDLDLKTRAAALLPHPPFRLDRSTRSALFAALGSAAVSQRIVQRRTLEDAPLRSLSDIAAVPLDSVVLRSPAAAERLFIFVVALLLVLLVAGHLYLRFAMPLADPLLWPVFGGLSVLGPLMLFAVVPPLTARGSIWPFLGPVPEYAGQGFVAAAAMLLLPASRWLLHASERLGRRWIGGLLGAAILIPNVLARFGWAAVFALVALLAGAGVYLLSTSSFGADAADPSSGAAGMDDPSSGAAGMDGQAKGDRTKHGLWSELRGIDFKAGTLGTALLLAGGVIALTFARLAGGQTGYAPLVEISKILLVLFTARICADYELFLGEGFRGLPKRALWELSGCWLAAMLLAFLSNDLGFLLLLWIPFTLLLSLSIGNALPIAVGLLGGLAGSVLLVLSGHSRFPERFSGWLDPWHAASSQMAEVFQRMASVPSVLAGAGLGQGARLAVSTDTRDVVLPLYYEHLGWVGIALVTILLLIGIHRLFRVGLRTRDSYAHWAALGFGCIYAVQTVYMIGADFGAWPLTGMTLAPIASGKAAAFFTLLMALFVLAASAQPEGAAGPERRQRARFVAGAFALFAALAFYADAKLVKIAVVDREATALQPIAGAPNRRAVGELSSLRTGRILARKTGKGDHAANLTALALSERNGSGDEPGGGPGIGGPGIGGPGTGGRGIGERGAGGEIRRYPLGAPSFPVVGVKTGRRVIGGEAEWRGDLTGLDAFVDRAPLTLPPDTLKWKLLLDLWRRQRHPLWPRDERIAPQDVQTTLVTEMQTSAYDALKSRLQNSRARSGLRPRKGAMLIVDVRTGDVLAYTQYPAPNPEDLEGGWEAWDRVATDPAGYLDPNGNLVDLVRHTDRAPGSTAKINTMMTLSEAGGANRTFQCRPGIVVNGQEIRDFHHENHGTVGLREILKVSCNRGAAQAAQFAGWDRLLSQYRKLRYSLPHMGRPEETFRRYYQQIAFGQAMSASLWELAMSIAAVARGGEAIELHMLRRNPEMVEKWRVCSPVTAALVADGMRAVDEPGGTAWTVYRGRRDWPSKTGSAQVAGTDQTDAWFVGYAPRRNPALAFVVWAEEDGTGSGLAAAIHLPDVIDGDLRSMGIVDVPPRAAASRRSRRQPVRTPGPLDTLLNRPELARPKQILNGLKQGFDRARETFGKVERDLSHLRR